MHHPPIGLSSTAVIDGWTDLGWVSLGAAGTFFAMAAVVKWNPLQLVVQWMVRTLIKVLYRVRIHGIENWPEQGAAVIVVNHLTWIDGALILMMAPRRTRMIAWAGNFQSRPMQWLASFANIILITGGPKSIRQGLEKARESLNKGEVVGIFPEGGLSKTSQLQAFKPGLMRIIGQRDVPVIPIYIDQTWGSIFSYSGGKSIWKLPRSIRHPISIHIGQAVSNPKDIFEVRQAVQAKGAQAVSKRIGTFVSPAQGFVRKCKKRLFRLKAADSTGNEVTGGALLLRSLLLRRLLRRYILDRDEQVVGVLIPPAVGAVVTNMALALDRRVAVHLNYTVSSQIMNKCIELAEIKHVLTTRKVLEKFDFQFDCEVSFLEDLREKVSLWDKICCALTVYLLPARLIESMLGLRQLQPDEPLTIIFTSGSTGTPKGVVLTNQNIATNVEAIEKVVCLNKKDTLVGILPFFHSFGYTVTLWAGMSLNVGAVYHFSPLDATQVGKLCERYKVTVLLATPTFLRSYLRRCKPEQFACLDIVVAGAEKLPAELSDAFEKKFGVRPVEGYGATELSPLASVNVPPSRSRETFQIDCKEGTVGRPVPNVAAKVTNVDTGEVLSENQEGTLWISGPNVMKGYLNQPELTAEVIRDGWYNTGDVALIDEDGFIKITGRISRFSKIGGEMVPHVTIEDTLSNLLDPEEQDEPRLAVTAVPDAKKGERLVVLHTQLRKTPGELCEGLAANGLPNLYIPSENSFFQVEQLPILGTGKLDLREMKEMAQQLADQQS